MTADETKTLIESIRQMSTELAQNKARLWCERIKPIVLAMDPEDAEMLNDSSDYAIPTWGMGEVETVVIMELPHWKYQDSMTDMKLPTAVLYGSDDDVAAFVALKHGERDAVKRKQEEQLAVARAEKQRKQEERERAEYERLQRKFTKD